MAKPLTCVKRIYQSYFAKSIRPKIFLKNQLFLREPICYAKLKVAGTLKRHSIRNKIISNVFQIAIHKPDITKLGLGENQNTTD